MTYKCPNCENKLAVQCIFSGNTIGSKLYSDGKSISPMMPEELRITKCEKCKTIFWLKKVDPKNVSSNFIKSPDILIDDGPLVSFLELDTKGPLIKFTPEISPQRANFLSIQDNFKTLELGLAENPEEEKYIRIRIWWRFNDRARFKKRLFHSEEEKFMWKENLKELLKLLDQKSINERIMNAEINRNLGNFEICESILESIKSSGYQKFKKGIMNKALKRSSKTFVFENKS